MASLEHEKDLYAILGISPDAPTNDIRSAYRMAARRFHPDVNHNAGAAIQFRDIASAYEILGDETRRRSYDTMRKRVAQSTANFFSVQVTPSKRVIPILGEAQVIYVMLEINANQEMARNTEKRTTPLNLALVLDRSMSMAGARLDRVKVAAHQIIDQLSPKDYLSLVSFSDRAEVLIRSQPVDDKETLKATVNQMSANGGTEIYQGLANGMRLIKQHLAQDYVNHIILLTDGRTYDREELSIQLAQEAIELGVGISAMGIGDEWNDEFLDELASRTGGASDYINSPAAVVKFLNNRVRSLGASYAERLELTVAPDSDVSLESVFKLNPHPQPIESKEQPIQLGTLEATRPITILLQLQMGKELKEGFRGLMRLDVTGDILHARRSDFKVLSDLSIEIAQTPPPENPPRNILDALGKLTLYRMQQKAEAAIQAGQITEATKRLENLATRLLEAGQGDLARTAMLEAKRVQATRSLSEEARMTMKFGTRMLLAGEFGDDEEDGDEQPQANEQNEDDPDNDEAKRP